MKNWRMRERIEGEKGGEHFGEQSEEEVDWRPVISVRQVLIFFWKELTTSRCFL